MRFYRNFDEAFNEIKRDLAELGKEVHTETMQDKHIADDPEFATMELNNYIYSVEKPHYDDIPEIHEAWVKAEWHDRLQGHLNPGHAWKERPEIWEEFKHKRGGDRVGRFAYTYSERMGGQHIQLLIDEFKRHPNTRQGYLPVWYRQDEERRGERRVPCTLGYWLVIRGGQMHLTYMMRSCDFVTHFPNDVCLAVLLQHYVAEEVGVPVGHYTHFMGSLHVYKKDVKGVF